MTVFHILESLDFVKSKHDPCVFIRRKNSSTIIIGLYVDDLFVFHDNPEEVEQVKQKLSEELVLKDLGELTYALGMKVERTMEEGKIILCISQKQYILDLLQKFGMTDAKEVPTPIVTNKFLDQKQVENVPYQELIGSLLYLSVCSRPDIAYATSLLSQFNHEHTAEHWQAAKRVLRYLKATVEAKLTYSGSSNNLTGYVDADWAGSDIDRKSYTGFAFLYGESVVSWECRKQKSTALSSTEAEYIALSEATKEAIHLSSLINELDTGYDSSAPVKMFNDNQSALKLSTSDGFHRRTKHVDVKYHHVRDLIQSGKITVDYLPTERMPADLLTKPLSREKVKLCCNGLGIVLT